MCKSTYGLAHTPACVTNNKWMNGDGKLLYFFCDKETCRSKRVRLDLLQHLQRPLRRLGRMEGSCAGRSCCSK